jgi:hypothetical protein
MAPVLAKLSSVLGLMPVVLSNVDCTLFVHTRAALKQGFMFTAEKIGSYKFCFPSLLF